VGNESRSRLCAHEIQRSGHKKKDVYFRVAFSKWANVDRKPNTVLPFQRVVCFIWRHRQIMSDAVKMQCCPLQRLKLPLLVVISSEKAAEQHLQVRPRSGEYGQYWFAKHSVTVKGKNLDRWRSTHNHVELRCSLRVQTRRLLLHPCTLGPFFYQRPRTTCPQPRRPGSCAHVERAEPTARRTAAAFDPVHSLLVYSHIT